MKQPVKGRPKLTCASTRVRRYPTEQQIMAVRPDFIVGAYGSAFAEERYTGATSYSRRGIFSDATVGPCDGENSDFFPAGTQHGQIAPLAVTEPGLCSSSWPLVALNGSAAGVLSGTLGTYLLPQALTHHRFTLNRQCVVHDAVQHLPPAAARRRHRHLAVGRLCAAFPLNPNPSPEANPNSYLTLTPQP